MKCQLFVLPALDSQAATQALNAFLSQHRILQVEKHFVSDGGNSFWSVCVSWIESSVHQSSTKAPNRVDYKEILDASDFAVFAALREWRKQQADRSFNLIIFC